MIEPVELEHFFIAFFTGAMVIITGALYALLFAWSRVHRRPWVMPAAYGCYALLVLCVMVLASVLHLTGFWQVVVAAMLIGYLLAPHGIWYLCQGTHTHEEESVLDRPVPAINNGERRMNP